MLLPPLRCPKCNILWNTFPGAVNYCQHQGVCPMSVFSETGITNPNVCQFCGKAFSGSIELANHVTSIHGSKDHDPVNHPKHYTSHPSGIECIEIARHMSFNIGNAMKYLWRADAKDAPIQDLEKAIWYINDEIKHRKANAKNAPAGGSHPPTY